MLLFAELTGCLRSRAILALGDNRQVLFDMYLNNVVQLLVVFWSRRKDTSHLVEKHALDVHNGHIWLEREKSRRCLLDKISRVVVLSTLHVLDEVELNDLSLCRLVRHVVEHSVLGVIVDVVARSCIHKHISDLAVFLVADDKIFLLDTGKTDLF